MIPKMEKFMSFEEFMKPAFKEIENKKKGTVKKILTEEEILKDVELILKAILE